MGVAEQVEQLLQRFLQRARAGEREEILLQLFRACGLNARGPRIFKNTERSFEVDGEFEATVDGRDLRFVVEVKGTARPEVVRRGLQQARRARHEGKYDRALLILTSDIAEELLREAEMSDIGYADVLGPRELRSWLSKNAPALQRHPTAEPSTCVLLIRTAMRAVAERLAQNPDEICTLEWRDLERVLREVFEGMGFDTTLTRSGKDGGFDLSLEAEEQGEKQLYLVEVKHWSEQKPGKKELRKLVRVTARERADRGILISSSGFSASVYQGFTEAERASVALGGRDKITALCRTYYRLGNELWTPDESLREQLLSGLR